MERELFRPLHAEGDVRPLAEDQISKNESGLGGREWKLILPRPEQRGGQCSGKDRQKSRKRDDGGLECAVSCGAESEWVLGSLFSQAKANLGQKSPAGEIQRGMTFRASFQRTRAKMRQMIAANQRPCSSKRAVHFSFMRGPA